MGRRRSRRAEAPAPGRPAPAWQSPWALAGLAAALYLNTLGHGYALDDDFVTRRNRFVQQGLGGLPEILTTGYFAGFDGSNDKQYRPVCTGSFAVEVGLWGERAGAHHLVNVALYAACAAVALGLCRALLPGAPPWVPVAGAALWVVHPVHTEAVANVKSRDELLLFLFLGTGLRAGIDWDRASPWRRAAGVAATLLACLSKETAVVQPAILLLAWHLTGKGVRRSLVAVLAHGGAVAASLGMRALVLDRMTFGGKLDVIDNTLAAAGGPGERLATATAILGRYLGLVAWPHPLAWDYSFARIPVVGWNDAGALASLGAHGLLAVAAALGIRRRRAAGFGLAFYALTMLLVSNVVVLIGATMGERFLFVPTFGLAVAAADVMGRASAAAWWRAAGALPALLLGVLLAAGAGATVVRNRAWKDNATLFQADIAVCGGSARARFALASEHRLAGERLPPGPRRDELLLLSEQGNLEALRIHPGYTQAWYNLGVTYDAMRDPTRAAAAYREVLARDPRHKEALNNSGVILFPQGKLAEAEAFFRRALEVDPAYADALGNVGACHHSRGELVEAMAMYEKALAVDPGNARMRRGIDDARAALAARGEPAAP